ncbi:hypothetical protein KBY85_03090 [Cyanobium sp. BA5m-10]|uniref:hypothetical protein n=1 Tax=Cyanobium sp. BA5m-10 TaxID=2823705 RepID=UPI0020CFDA83|nr:hypothetical protein [Cyanobium sp. BA5m-10]MCP9903127.1 hypothetical protein [Cyanobium sp. BA5m-10]
MAPIKKPSTGAEGQGPKLLGLTLTPLEHRYPLAAAAESLARLQWDHDHAGSLQHLAEVLGSNRYELLIRRWKLQVLAPMQQQVAANG